MPSLWITRPLPEAVIDAAHRRYDVTVRTDTRPVAQAEMIEALTTYDAILPTLGDPLSAATLSAVYAPRTRILANFGVGYNHIDVDAARAAGIAVTNTPGLGAATQALDGETLSEVGSLANAGAVGLSNGNQAITRPDVMMRVMSYAKAFGQTLHHFPFDPYLSKGMMNKGALATQLGLSASSKLAEILMVQRDISLCREASAPIHLGPLTCAESLALVREAKANNLPVTCSTAPQYFCFNELEIQDYRTYAKLNPPLRSEEDRAAVAKAVADGTIDGIVSDHCPQDMDSKRVPFEQAAFGMVGLETLLTLSLTLYHTSQVELHRLLGALTWKPADLLGINAGRLKIGNSADIVVFDLDRPLRLDNSQLRGKSKNSPLEGFPAQGKAVMTFVDGRLLFDHR